MLGKLLTEQVNPQSANIDTLGTESMLRVMNAEDRKVADAVAQAIPSIARALDGIVARVTGGGRLFYIGADNLPRKVFPRKPASRRSRIGRENRNIRSSGMPAVGNRAASAVVKGEDDDPARETMNLVPRRAR